MRVLEASEKKNLFLEVQCSFYLNLIYFLLDACILYTNILWFDYQYLNINLPAIQTW